MLKRKKIEYILTINNKNDLSISNCLDNLILKSDKSFAHVSRNPLNKDRNSFYHGYI